MVSVLDGFGMRMPCELLELRSRQKFDLKKLKERLYTTGYVVKNGYKRYRRVGKIYEFSFNKTSRVDSKCIIVGGFVEMQDIIVKLIKS